jgi:hypothetical protein
MVCSLGGYEMPESASSFFVGSAPNQQRARTTALQQPVIDPNTGQPTNDPNAIIAAANQRGGRRTIKINQNG